MLAQLEVYREHSQGIREVSGETLVPDTSYPDIVRSLQENAGIVFFHISSNSVVTDHPTIQLYMTELLLITELKSPFCSVLPYPDLKFDFLYPQMFYNSTVSIIICMLFYLFVTGSLYFK